MKSNKYILAFALLGLFSCSDVYEDVAPTTDDCDAEMIIEAGVMSRTQMLENGDIWWTKGDEIALMRESDGAGILFSSLAVKDSASARFKGVRVDNECGVYYAIYPYAIEDKSVDYAAQKLGFTLPAVQSFKVANGESFDEGVNPSVAQSTDKEAPFQFKNLCGGVQVRFAGNEGKIGSIKVSVIDAMGQKQPLAGKASVDMSSVDLPITFEADGSSQEIVLDCDDYVLSSIPQSFTIMVPPTTTGTKLNIDVEMSEGVDPQPLEVAYDVKRGRIKVLTDINYIQTDGSIKPVETIDIDDIADCDIPDNLWIINSSSTPTLEQMNAVAKRVNQESDDMTVMFADVVTIPQGELTTPLNDGSKSLNIIFPEAVNIGANAFAAWDNVNMLSFAAKSKLVVAMGAFDGLDTSACDLNINASYNDPFVVPDWKGYVWKSINGGRIYSVSELDENGYLPDGTLPVGEIWVFKANKENRDTMKRLWFSVKNYDAPVGVKLFGELSSNDIMLFKFDGDNANVLSNYITSLDFSQLKGLNRLEDSACRELKKLKYVNLPASMKYVGDRTFNDCPLLARVEYNGKLAPVLEDNLKDEVRKIADFAFFGCAFDSIDLSWATVVGNGILSGCSKLTSVKLSSATTFGREILANANLVRSIDMKAEGDFVFTGDNNEGGKNLFYGIHYVTDKIDLKLNVDKYYREATPYATASEWLVDGRYDDLNPLKWNSITFIKVSDSFESDNETIVPVL